MGFFLDLDLNFENQGLSQQYLEGKSPPNCHLHPVERHMILKMVLEEIFQRPHRCQQSLHHNNYSLGQIIYHRSIL